MGPSVLMHVEDSSLNVSLDEYGLGVRVHEARIDGSALEPFVDVLERGWLTAVCTRTSC